MQPGEEEGVPYNDAPAMVQHQAICSLENLSLVTQLPLDFLQQVGFTAAYIAGQKVVRIVCRDEEGGSWFDPVSDRSYWRGAVSVAEQ